MENSLVFGVAKSKDLLLDVGMQIKEKSGNSESKFYLTKLEWHIKQLCARLAQKSSTEHLNFRVSLSMSLCFIFGSSVIRV